MINVNIFNPKRRPAERTTAKCRVCDGGIAKGEEMISWWSHWGQGMHIHMHLACAVKIGELAFGRRIDD